MQLLENEISELIIKAAIEVHSQLGGPGLLESIYEEALVMELKNRNLMVKRQVAVPIMYKGNLLRDSLRLDILVNDMVVIEVKASENNHPSFKAQTLTYLRLSNFKLGLVVNFGKERLVDGLFRVVNKL